MDAVPYVFCAPCAYLVPSEVVSDQGIEPRSPEEQQLFLAAELSSQPSKPLFKNLKVI